MCVQHSGDGCVLPDPCELCGARTALAEKLRKALMVCRSWVKFGVL